MKREIYDEDHEAFRTSVKEFLDLNGSKTFITNGGSADLAFDDVRVSSADLIGPLDTGFISMMQFLPQERLGSAVTDLAHARQILEETV